MKSMEEGLVQLLFEVCMCVSVSETEREKGIGRKRKKEVFRMFLPLSF